MLYRLLTLWFEYGEERRVYESLVKGLKLISIENWLQVIPQLIARIDTSRQSVGKLIQTLLCDISKHHPQVSHLNKDLYSNRRVNLNHPIRELHTNIDGFLLAATITFAQG